MKQRQVAYCHTHPSPAFQHTTAIEVQEGEFVSARSAHLQRSDRIKAPQAATQRASMGDTFGDKFKKAFKIGGGSKDTSESESPLAHGAHGTGMKVRPTRAMQQCSVGKRFLRGALAKFSKHC